MPKAQKGAAGTARIRLVILEAEAPDGDLGQITEAVQNALRPTNGAGPVRRALSGPAKTASADNDPVELTAVEEGEAADSRDEADVAAPTSRSKGGSNWKPRPRT
jgi:hypothetical protein